MRNIIRIGAGTDRRNRFVAIALGVALAAGPAVALPAAALAAPATDAAAASTTAGATITLQGADGASLASTGSDTTAIATLAAIMTIAGAGCVLVRVRSAKHADGWHAVED